MLDSFKSPLMRQLGVIIALLIISIEAVLLVTSIESERNELNDIRKALNTGVTQNGLTFEQLHPGILDAQDIERRLSIYKRNIILLTLLITVIVTIGTIAIFYKITGRHLLKLASLGLNHHSKDDASTSAKEYLRYPKDEIPDNELGTVILSREKMLDDLIGHEEQIEKKLELAQQDLLQSAKLSLVGELTSGLVHDLKNPLSVVVSYNSLLKKPEYRAKKSDEELENIYQKLEVATTRIQEMVERMGKMGRKDQEFKDDICLEEVIADSLLFLKSKIADSDVSVVNNTKQIKIFGDHNMLEQVFSNLIANACDAIAKAQSLKREVVINASELEKRITITIEDSGPGISDDVLPYIFDSFYTTKERGKGTGLGLSTVKQIIEKHGGEISAESKLGVGTLFTIVLNKQKLS
jgi:signal transduction histidine kinase